MKKNKLIPYLIVVFLVISGLFSNSVNASNFTVFSDQVVENPIEVNIIEIPIFGYSLNCEAEDPMNWDEAGIVVMKQESIDLVSINIETETGKYAFPNLLILDKLFVDLSGNHNYLFDINNTRRGFFMEMEMLNNITLIDLTFDGGESQMCYQGVLAKGHTSITPLSTKNIETITVEVDNMNENRTMQADELSKEMELRLKTSISVFKSDEKSEEKSSKRTFNVTDYGIAHEVADFENVTLPEDLPDDYWETYSDIDIGIYRCEPSETQIKSDLQYYNKYYYDWSTGDGYNRNIKAYAIYAHGTDLYEDEETAWQMEDSGWLYPDEVEDLWGVYFVGMTETEYFPTDMIILATVCYGYSADTSSTPYMAKAFVDNYATAFIGATTTIPGVWNAVEDNDDFTEDFWYDLCQDDETIDTATSSYISAHNNLNIPGEPTWVKGTHIKIYGDDDEYLD